MTMNLKSVRLRLAALGLAAALPCGLVATSAAEDHLILSRVEGQAAIVSVKPQGVQVAKGDLICELDSAAIRDKLSNQQLITRAAEASLKNARLNREVAEIDVKEQGELGEQDRQTAKKKVAFAEGTLDLRKKLLDEAVRKKVPESERLRAEQDVKQAEIKLTEAQGDLGTLQRVTIPSRQRETKAALDRTLGEEVVKKAAWEAEVAREKKLLDQIEACRIVAPVAGQLLYANGQAAEGAEPAVIEEGASVSERQKLFLIRPKAADAGAVKE